MIDFASLSMYVLLALGFGFIIFFHELGHFLAAKWADIKVEQFAVGFGHAVVAWRKGVGLTLGNTRARMEQLREQAEQTGQPEPKFGDTEYRLNWIPFGGYVKMLGQDDLHANAEAADPRAYNNRPVGKRMVVVSAGVLMNLLLALIGFVILFRVGLNETVPVVGRVESGSPAQHAGIQVGDRIVSLDGEPQVAFDKLMVSVALARAGPLPVVVRRPGVDHDIDVSVTPAHSDTANRADLPLMGISPSAQLVSFHKVDWKPSITDLRDEECVSPQERLLEPGDSIVAIDGRTVDPLADYYLLDRALQNSDGQPVPVTIKSATGQTRDAVVMPMITPGDKFDKNSHFFAGLEPRAMVEELTLNSPLRGIVKPGDVILRVETAKPDSKTTQVVASIVGVDRLLSVIEAADTAGEKIALTVLRGDREITTEPVAAVSIPGGRRGVGITRGFDTAHPIIGEIAEGSAADQASITAGATIRSINGKPVNNWFDVRSIIAGSIPGRTVKVVTDRGTFNFNLTEQDVQSALDCRVSSLAVAGMRPWTEIRQTANILIAAQWGFDETRQLMAEFYLTLRRMASGRVSPKNLAGPLGIIQFGAQAADRGADWLLWFLSMISVNLAVVNFLPIPIVDGGLFIFLIIEKLQRRPISPRVQTAAQAVGLALILTVFVFVSYFDVIRWSQH